MNWIPFILLLFSGSSLQYTILHLADFHLDVDYSIHGDTTQMCHQTKNSTNNTLGTYGDYMCDSPQSLVGYTLDEAKRLFPNPDMIIWTGDNTPHVDGYGWQYVYNAVNLTTSIILSRYSNVSHILPTFGNHDYAPSNGFDQYSQLYKYTWNLWGPLIGDSQKDTFLKGGYYKKVVDGKATFLVLNTNLYYNNNKAYDNFTNKADPSDMFTFMENELAAAAKCANQVVRNCTSIVHVVAHIPPGAFERTPQWVWFRPEYNERWLNITIKYANTIKWMLYGHHHTDTFHLVKDSSNKAVQLSLMAPAVTPWFSDLAGAGANNPAFRIYDTDGWTGIKDIRTFYVNLTNLNANQKTAFQFEYSFRTAYGLKSTHIDATAMDSVLQRMKTNDSVFATYINYNSVLWKPKIPTGQFRLGQLCALEFSDYPRYQQCLNPTQAGSAYSLYGILLYILFYLII